MYTIKRGRQMGDIKKIGSSIRRLRKQQKLTLQQMSAATGLSVGYLSYLERNEKSPTLVNLQKICEVLHTSLGDLLERNAEEKVIIRREDREITVDEANNTKIETMDFGREFGSYLYMTIEPGSSFEGTYWAHKCHEVGTVLSGEMTVDVDGEIYDLKEGDCILIKAHSRHCCYNRGEKEPVVSFWSRFWPEDSETESEEDK